MMFRLVIVFLTLSPLVGFSQTADVYFHTAAKQYIDAQDQIAKNTLETGLRRFPNDPKLRGLRDKIKEDEKKEQEEKKQQEQKDQQNKDKNDKQDKEEKEKDQQQKNDQKEKEEQQQDEQQKKDEEKKDQQKSEEEKESEKKEQQNPDFEKKLEEMKITPEKAKMILEAMKNQEKQYLQQNKRKATKPRNTNKPQY